MPYTEALVRSIPKLADPSHTRLNVIPGRPPDLVKPPKGCNFSPRCPYVQDKCREEEPPLIPAPAVGHEFACWFPVGTPEGRAALERNIAARPHGHDPGGRLMAGSGTAHLRSPEESLLRVEHLVVEFPAGRGNTVHAVSDVSLDILEGETLGLVGESGCGKSTTGRAVMQLPRPTSGEVTFEGKDLGKLSGEDLRRTRTRMQMIFQDPISSLNPRRRVKDLVAEGLNIWKIGDDDVARRRRCARCSRRWASTPTPPGRAARTSSPVASASASRSPGPSSPTPGSSSATSRSRLSTCRSRPRSSTCSRT